MAAISKWMQPSDLWLTPQNSEGTATSGVTTGTTMISQWMQPSDTWLTSVNSNGTATSGVTTGTTMISTWQTTTDTWGRLLLKYLNAKVIFVDSVASFKIDTNGLLAAVNSIDEGNKGYDLPTLSYNDLNTRSNVIVRIKAPTAVSAAGQGYNVVLNYDGDFTDKTGRVWNTVGTGVSIVPSVGMFGSPAMSLDGASHIETPVTDDLKAICTGDFTIRWYEKRTVASTYATAMCFNANGDYDFVIGLNAGGNLVCYAGDGSSFSTLSAFNLGTYTIGEGAVYELGRKGNTFFGFKNGKLTGTAQSANPINFASFDKMIIGNRPNTFESHLIGVMDEVIVRVGICEHTSDYPLPTSPVTLTPTVPVRMTQTSIIQSTPSTAYDLTNRTGVVKVTAVAQDARALFSFDNNASWVGLDSTTPNTLKQVPRADLWSSGIPLDTIGNIPGAEWAKFFQRGLMNYVVALGPTGSLTSMEVQVPAQSAPLLNNMVISASTTHLGAVDITGEITDNDNDAVQYRVVVNGTVTKDYDPGVQGPLPISVSLDPHTLKLSPATNNVVIEARDAAGLTTTKSYTVTVLNKKPVAIIALDVMLGIKVDVADMDGDVIDYEIAIKKASQPDTDYRVVKAGKGIPVPFSEYWVPPLNTLDLGETYVYQVKVSDTLVTEVLTQQFVATQRGLVIRDKVTGNPLNDELGNIISSVFLGTMYAGGSTPAPVPVTIENLTGSDIKDLTLAIRDTSADKYAVMISDNPNFTVQSPILDMTGTTMSLGAKMDVYMVATTQADATPGVKMFYFDVGFNKP